MKNDNSIDTEDLGEMPEEIGGPMGSPTLQSAGAQKSYPTVMLTGGKHLMNIPDSGHLKFAHKVVARHMPHGHQSKHRVEIELRSLHRARAPKKPAHVGDDDGARVKRLMGGD